MWTAQMPFRAVVLEPVTPNQSEMEHFSRLGIEVPSCSAKLCMGLYYLVSLSPVRYVK